MLVKLKNIIAENDVTLAKMGTEVNAVHEFLMIMEDYCYSFSDEGVQHFWLLKEQPLVIKSAILKGRDNVSKSEERLKFKLERDKLDFERRLTELQELFEGVRNF